MDDMRGLVLKAALLRMKRADDEGTPYGGYALGAGEGLAGAGLLAGTANWARNVYNRTPPSFLQMAEQVWRNPENESAYRAALPDQARAGEVWNAMQDPSVLRRVLLNRSTSAITPGEADAVRQATFGGGNNMPASLGDALLSDVPGRGLSAITGLPLTHAGMVGPNNQAYSYGYGLDAGHQVSPMERMWSVDEPLVRLRDTSLTPEQRSQLGEAVPRVYGGIKRYDPTKKTDSYAREMFPETATAEGGSWLTRPLDWLAGNRRASGFMRRNLPKTTYRTLFGGRGAAGLRCPPGETCSTAAGRVLEDVAAPLREQTSMRDFLENTGVGKRFNVAEMHLPEHMQTPEFLTAMSRERWGPLALRAPVMAGGAALGAYGMYDAANRLAAAARPTDMAERIRETRVQPTAPQTVPPAPAADVTPGRLHLHYAGDQAPAVDNARAATNRDIFHRIGTGLGNWWHNVMHRYGGGV